ncbi:MAG TPA: hypothetical protein VEW42_05315 [Candidatus Eisenbacteria bacterium]|nr:hypothetical protein [Candidatus Eisenbacteria bacterium]
MPLPWRRRPNNKVKKVREIKPEEPARDTKWTGTSGTNGENVPGKGVNMRTGEIIR